jgi:hypothetical protein
MVIAVHLKFLLSSWHLFWSLSFEGSCSIWWRLAYFRVSHHHTASFYFVSENTFSSVVDIHYCYNITVNSASACHILKYIKECWKDWRNLVSEWDVGYVTERVCVFVCVRMCACAFPCVYKDRVIWGYVGWTTAVCVCVCVCVLVYLSTLLS